MNELIKLTQQTLNNEEVNTVNARELHEFLDVGRDFTTWIKGRLSTLGSIENEDYLLTKTGEQLPSGTKYRSDYYLSLDTAKHIAMMEKSDKGKLIREYFIECEKKLKEIMSSKDSLLLGIFKAEGDIAKAEAINRYETGYVRPLENKVEAQAEQLAEAAPKVKYYDLVLSCPNTVPIRNIAQDYGWSVQKMNKKLNELGIQYKQGKIWVLTTSYLTQGYARLETIVLNPETPKQAVVQSLKWTQKGRLMIYEILKSEGILPVCERDDILGES